jgi:N-acetyl-anhydromuramyl-L-alanine amidase AmpD
MDRAPGYIARWHLQNGLPIPQGAPLDYVLDALAVTLGPIPTGVDADESDLPADVVPAAIVARTYQDVIHTTANKGGTLVPEGIVFHSSYGSAAGSLSWIKNSASKVSYHTLIFPDGTRHNVVPFDRVAWHAGVSTYRGRRGCNGFMIGLSFEGDLYKRQLSEDEIASAVEISVRLMRQYGFGLDWVTDHRTISPGRKEDIPPATLATIKNRIAAAL